LVSKNNNIRLLLTSSLSQFNHLPLTDNGMSVHSYAAVIWSLFAMEREHTRQYRRETTSRGRNPVGNHRFVSPIGLHILSLVAARIGVLEHGLGRMGWMDGQVKK
jgi:hypothetical protein